MATYGSPPPSRGLQTLYEICAVTGGYPFEPDPDHGLPVGGLNPNELLGALALCPNHPRAVETLQAITERQAVDAAAHAELDRLATLAAEGKHVSSGSYLVGAAAAPGTWQSDGESVEDCYWEVSDAQGNIIDNNFISIAPQITIAVPASAAGFTVSGCTFTWVGP